MPEAARDNRWNTLSFLLVFVICAVYMGANLKRDWVPHDEGTLAQTAERILAGEIPHRDFDDPYTGGLAYLDALAFRILGVNLLALRSVLFVFFLAWVPVVFAIAHEFSGSWTAAGVTFLAVAWSVPKYAAATPSWFCLFFATFGAFAVLRYIERPRNYLLTLAGLFGGFSFLMKSPGLFYVAGVLLFLVFREQSLSQNVALKTNSSSHRTFTWYFAFLFASLVLFLLLLTKLVMETGGEAEFLHFVLPGAAIVCLLLFREHVPPDVNSQVRFKILFTMLLPFLFGVAIPILFFCAVFLFHGGFHALSAGLFVSDVRRTLEARRSPPDWIAIVPALLLTFFLAMKIRTEEKWFTVSFKLLCAALVLWSAAKYPLPFVMIVYCFWGMIPVLAVITAVTLGVLSTKGSLTAVAQQRAMLLLAITAMCSLVQFPFSAPIYFCYVAPLTILTVAAFISLLDNPPRRNIQIAGVFFLIFAVLLFHQSFVLRLRFPSAPEEETAVLNLPRGQGLRISAADAAEFGDLIPFISSLAGGKPILAGPDCPEVYFLAGVRNPTRSLFEFLEDPQEYTRHTENLLNSGVIKVVVIHQHPQFSLVERNILTNLTKPRFHESRIIGDFVVYWRP